MSEVEVTHATGRGATPAAGDPGRSRERAGVDHMVTATPLWFGPEHRPLFGWVHGPADRRSAGAVVLCPPLARELACAHYTYRLLAEELAEAGMLAIRFDYDGTGDSAGSERDPGRVAAWLESIGEAIALARRCGVTNVSLVGMRMGALLAAVAAARQGGVDGLVLWDPLASGRSFLREQSALQRLRSDLKPLDDGRVELPGFVYSAETVAELGALAMPEPARVPRRALVLTRPERTPLNGLIERLGVEPELGEAIGQDQLLEVEPLYHEIPKATSARIVEWLGKEEAEPRVELNVPVRDRASFHHDGARLTERFVWLGDVSMFGVVTEPEQRLDAPSIMLLNAGNDWHVGPNRLWVDVARRWAALGFRCLRFDESGLGDSPARPGVRSHVVRLPETFEDVHEAQDSLEPGDPTNVIMVGLCSGGYQALENALVRPARGVYAINPILHFTPPELAWGPMDPRRRICFPSSSLVSAYRNIPGLAPLRRGVRGIAWRALRLLHRDRDPSSWLDELRESGVRVLVIGGENETRPFGTPAGTGDAELVQIEVVPGLDHALMPAWHRDAVLQRMTEHLVEHFAPGAGSRPGRPSA